MLQRAASLFVLIRTLFMIAVTVAERQLRFTTIESILFGTKGSKSILTKQHASKITQKFILLIKYTYLER